MGESKRRRATGSVPIATEKPAALLARALKAQADFVAENRFEAKMMIYRPWVTIVSDDPQGMTALGPSAFPGAALLADGWAHGAFIWSGRFAVQQQEQAFLTSLINMAIRLQRRLVIILTQAERHQEWVQTLDGKVSFMEHNPSESAEFNVIRFNSTMEALLLGQLELA